MPDLLTIVVETIAAHRRNFNRHPSIVPHDEIDVMYYIKDGELLSSVTQTFTTCHNLPV